MTVAPHFDRSDDHEIESRRPLAAPQMFEIVRRTGEHELQRPAMSLSFSGFAAGLAMGFSVVAEAALATRLPEAEWSGLIADMGYTVGFILVIFGRLQLFTETTITPVMPLCHAPTRGRFLALGRLWGIVFAMNIAGATVFAAFALFSGAFSAEMIAGMLAIGVYYIDMPAIRIFAGGVGAGFLIAALVWMLAHVKTGAVLLVFLVTYVIAIAGFAHVIAGGVETAMLLFAGAIGFGEGVFGFMLPALAGNTVGGAALFTLIAYAQVRNEI